MEKVEENKTQNPFAETVQIIADAAKANGGIWLQSVESIKNLQEKARHGGYFYEAKITVKVRIPEPS